jgi:ribosomal protein L37E
MVFGQSSAKCGRLPLLDRRRLYGLDNFDGVGLSCWISFRRSRVLVSLFQEEQDAMIQKRKPGKQEEQGAQREEREVVRCRGCGRRLLYNVDTECCAGCYGRIIRKADHRIKHGRD